jgi:hypothetical protein
MQEQCVGVDVSKLQLDWALGGEGAVSRVNNTPAGVRSLTAKLRRCDAALIIVESTGGYERPLVEALAKANLPVVLVNPWRVRRFSEGMGVLAKTDPVDARILALFGERARPPRRPLPGLEFRMSTETTEGRSLLVPGSRPSRRVPKRSAGLICSRERPVPSWSPSFHQTKSPMADSAAFRYPEFPTRWATEEGDCS